MIRRVHARDREIYREERERKERERKKVGFSPIGKREEEGVLTLPLKLERGDQTCPAWIQWSHMQGPVGP